LIVDQPLRLANSDPVGHNVKIEPQNSDGINRTIPGGGEDSYTFSAAENKPVAVQCTIHTWMKAYLLPRKDSYFAVSGPDGSFEIKNLPAGEPIEIQVWHELASDGLSARGDWAKGRFPVNIEEDGEVVDLGVIEVSPEAFK
jgi:hypothetical protein